MSEEQQSFLLRLSDSLRQESDPIEVQATVTRSAMEHFGADRCYYCEIEGDNVVIRQDAARDGLPSVVGVYPLSSIPIHKALIDAGQPFAVADVHTTNMVDEDLRQSCIQLKVISYMDIPIVKGGKAVGILCVVQSSPRQWSDSDIALAVEVSERTWAAVERSRTEQALRVSEEKFRTLANAAPALIWHNNAHGENVFLNQHFLEYTGKSAEDITGEGWHEIVHPDDADTYISDYLAAVREQRAWNNRNRIRRYDGEWRWFHNYAQPLFDPDGVFLGHVGVSTDITDTVSVEESLRKNEARHAFLLRLSDALRLLTDTKEIQSTSARMLGEHLGANEVRCTETYGDSHIGEHLTTTGSTVVCHDTDYEGAVSKAEANGIAPSGFRAYIVVPRAKDGELIATLSVLSVTPRRWRPDEVALVEEVWQRTWASIDLVKADTLLRESEERFRYVAAQLQEADYRKDEFIGILSHEIRNPLAAIRMGLYLLEHESALSDRAVTAREIMSRQVTQLARLIDDLLDITRINRNKIVLQPKRVDMTELLQQVVGDYRESFREKETELATNLCVEPLYVNADEVRLVQVVGNLLHNALKFTPQAGLVVVSLTREGPSAVLRVEDNGIGMTQDNIGVLFTPFMQADKSVYRGEDSGLGLGLVLVKGLTELHGGEVRADSQGLGKGSVFTVCLPLDDEQVAESPETDISVAPMRRLRILIVEDIRDVADSLKALLQSHGHEVRVTYDGAESISVAKEFRPDILLCDIGLPGMDGYEVAKAFKANKELHSVRLISVTGYARPQDLQRAKLAGFAHHIAKPVDLKQLRTLLAGLSI